MYSYSNLIFRSVSDLFSTIAFVSRHIYSNQKFVGNHMRVSIIYIYIYFPSYIYINIYIYICSHTRRKNNILLYVPTDLLITSRSVSSLLFGFVKLRKSLLGFRIGTCFCDYLFIKNTIYIYTYIDQCSQDFLSRDKTLVSLTEGPVYELP